MKPYLTKIAFVAVSCALVAGTFAIIGPGTVRAAVATLVQVVNTPDNPVPVREINQTSSAGVRFNGGETSVTINQLVPTCPNGTEFLFTALTAEPDLIFTQNYPTGSWGAAVNVVQKFQSGAISRSIAAYAVGAQHASVTLPAGQPSFNVGTVGVIVRLLNGPAPGSISFIVHLTGYCGVAYVSPQGQ